MHLHYRTIQHKYRQRLRCRFKKDKKIKFECTKREIETEREGGGREGEAVRHRETEIDR